MKKPTVLIFVSDLMFSARILSAVESLDFEGRIIEDAGLIAASDPQAAENRPGEHLQGRTAVLIDQVSRWRPALMIFDLNNAAVPWRRWIGVLKSAPATRRIPIITFGQHTDVPRLAAARNAGADLALARSAFVMDIPALIKKHARVPDYAAIQAACRQPLSELGLEGIRLFNTADYFEAHEVLEQAWNADDSPARELYRAILQLAVAYLQIERGNYAGAVKMFLRLRQWMEPLPDECRGVNIARLRQDAGRVEASLLELGPERIRELDRGLFRPVQVLPQE